MTLPIETGWEPVTVSVTRQVAHASAGTVRSQISRVALVCMPFASANEPSIQVGLLGAEAQEAGFPVDGYYFNLDLSVRIGPERYEWLCKHRGYMTGEWLFSIAAFGPNANLDDKAYFDAFPSEAKWFDSEGESARRGLSDLRHNILPRYIDDCVESVNWGMYDVVGFTSTFQQTVASLAMARRIKERFPAVVVVFGGCNMEGPMGAEHLRAFECIDYVVSGEGDIVFPRFLRSLDANEPIEIVGVLCRDRNHVGSPAQQAPPVQDLDALPIPDYGDFYRRSRLVGLAPEARLPIEGSRGCWWGQKHHCTFCGLNGIGMGYRAKTPGRFLREAEELSRRHNVYRFDAVDNILFPKFLSGVFGPMAEQRNDLEFFFEVKSNLGREQLRSMYRGGVRCIQPGIESMSTHVLTLMDKGSTMLDNVRILKWCRYYGINVVWNLLYGFPGETVEDYQQQLGVLELLSHLQPPSAMIRIWLERFSPYFTARDRYPIRDIRAESSYGYVYPSDVLLDDIAYFFEYSMDDTVEDEELVATTNLITAWRASWANSDSPGSLTYRRTPYALAISDGRGGAKPSLTELEGPRAAAYECCVETARSVEEVRVRLQELGMAGLTRHDIRGTLEEFQKGGLMVGESDRYLSLAIPTNPNW